MSAPPPLVCPAPRVVKACEACRSRKQRCLTSDTAGTCRRCLSLAIECRYAVTITPAAKPGGRQKGKTATLELSKNSPRVLGTTGEDDVLNALFQSKAPGPKLDPLAAVKSIHSQLFDKIVQKTPYCSASTTPQTQPLCSSLNSPAEEVAYIRPKSSPKLGKDDIRRYLTRFQESQTYFPFVRLPYNITLETMMRFHPFLLLGILAAMSVPDVDVHQRLDAKFKRVLSEKTIEREEKSLDLLQGLLVYLTWYPIHLNPKGLQVMKFLQMAVDLVVDLKFDRHSDMLFDIKSRDSDTHKLSNERLAYLGCYYISTSIVLPFGRHQPIPFSPYMQFCLEFLPHDDTEARAQVLVKVHHLVEQATELNKIGAQPGSLSKDSQIELLIRRLDAIQQSLSPANASHPSMIFSLDFARERIYAVHTPMPKFPVHPDSPYSRIHLSECLAIIIKLLTHIISLPPTVFTTFTYPEWYHIIEMLVGLSRLCFPIPSIPSWDPASTRQIAKYLPLVTGFQAKMEEVVKLLASRSSPYGENGHKKGTVSIPSLFSAVLTILVDQYKERVYSFIDVDTPFNLFDPQDHQNTPHITTLPDSQQCHAIPTESQHIESIYPMKSGLCPVMSGALRSTGYWDAMDAFKNEFGTTGGVTNGADGDAWMGSTVDGELFDGNIIEDCGLWDLQAAQWEGNFH